MLSARAAKAYVGAAVAAASSLAPVVDDGLTAGESLIAVGAALVAFQAVYWTSNAKAPKA
jgi:hypothetical protein